MSVDLAKITNSSSIAESELLANSADPAEATAKSHSNKEIDAKERHLSTDHLLTELKGGTISGAFITIVAQGVQFVIDAPPRRQLRSVGAISRLRSSWSRRRTNLDLGANFNATEGVGTC